MADRDAIDKDEIYRGRCQCGHIQFEARQQPVVIYACHCTDCQKQSSSAFGISVWFEREFFNITSGKMKFWNTTTESGNPKDCAFCPECGCRIYHVINSDSKILSVKGGTLDQMHKLKLAGHIWTRSALTWSLNQDVNQSPSQQALCYDTEPESFAEIIKHYQTNTPL